MKVFVTGGTGVIGQVTVTALVQRGHRVRLFSREATKDAKQWPNAVEARDGSISDAAALHGAADGCDVVLHLAGIVHETPPDTTFRRINIEGTRHAVREAERAGVNRFVYVSSLGADRGESEYHKSKREAEAIVRTFRGDWVICRPGNVYGPGDEQISVLLQMVRSLPVVPMIDRGNQPFEPIWADDLGAALVQVCERADLAGQTLELAGPDRTTMSDLIDRMKRITGRSVSKLPIPGLLASTAAKLAGAVHLEAPIDEGQITMLTERNTVSEGGTNALVSVLNVTPTSLDEGLRKLADAMPEQLPESGVGSLKRKRYWADIVGSRLSAEALLTLFRERFAELTPWQLDVGTEPGTETARVEEGATLTMTLPLRGNIQIRVAEITDRRMTFITVEGHPLAGAVRFLAEQRGAAIRFEIQGYDKAANVVDWLTMSLGGGMLQNRTWESTVSSVVEESGGTAPGGVQQETETLDEQQAAEIQEWLEGLITDRKRATMV